MKLNLLSQTLAGLLAALSLSQPGFAQDKKVDPEKEDKKDEPEPSDKKDEKKADKKDDKKDDKKVRTKRRRKSLPRNRQRSPSTHSSLAVLMSGN